MSTDDIRARDERKKVLAVYGLFAASLITAFIPTTTFCLIALLLFIAIVPAAEHVAHKSAPESLSGTHMTYIIRTVWLVSVAAVAMLIPASAYIYIVYDTAPLAPCVEKMAATLDQGQGLNPLFVMPCVPAFMEANEKLLTAAGLIIGIPATLYTLWRLGYGFIRALRGESIVNAKRWL